MKPDMIVVLVDISAEGSEVTQRKWISVIEQFEGILGHHSSLPLLIVIRMLAIVTIWREFFYTAGPNVCLDYWILVGVVLLR